MSSTDAGSEPAPNRPFRDRPLGRIVILLVVLAVALLALKTCASRDTDVSQDEAIEIAREEIDFEPDRTMVRFLPRGVDSRPFWAVSFSLLDAAGNPERITVVLVDGTTGEVEEIRRQDR
jgi:hypothetical protein